MTTYPDIHIYVYVAHRYMTPYLKVYAYDQVQHNIENVAANEANLEAKIEKKKVMKWRKFGDWESIINGLSSPVWLKPYLWMATFLL